MRRIRYSVAMSLDGHIAGPNGEYDWIIMDPEIDFKAIFAEFDAVLMGRKTFEASGGGGPMQGKKTYVVSRTLKPKDHTRVSIINGDVESEIASLRQMDGRDVWLFGGGELFRSLVSMRLVDSVEIAVIPVLLGGGIPLLPSPSDRIKLRLNSQKALRKTGTLMLAYAIDYQ